jgi:hypothetical protein
MAVGGNFMVHRRIALMRATLTVVKHDRVRALGPHVTMVGSQELVADVAAAHVAVVKDDGG